MNKRTIVVLLCLLLASQIVALFYLETFVANLDAQISPPDSNGNSTIRIDFNAPKNITQAKQVLAPALHTMGLTMSNTGNMVTQLSNNMGPKL